MKYLLKTSLLAILALLVVQCEKNDPSTQQGKVEFIITAPSLLKTTQTDSSSTISSLIVSIKDADGNIVKDKISVDLYVMNGQYISGPVSLLPGNYLLSEFFVLDEGNSIVYATPKEESPKAYLVEDPLDIEFRISNDEVTNLRPEVISTQNLTPEDFGYVSFNLDIVRTFDFLIAVFTADFDSSNLSLTTANLIVKNNDNILLEQELGDSTNQITLRADIDSFDITVKKLGYQMYQQKFSAEKLKSYFASTKNSPLTVVLLPQTEATVVLQPGPEEAKDAHLWSCRPDEKRGDFYYFDAKSWTWNGQGDGPGFTRSLIEFDLSFVPSNATITSAKLSLYTDPRANEYVGTRGHSPLSGSNAATLQRVTSPWVESEVTWNTQPTSTTENEVVLEESSAPDQNYLDIDVTQLVQDILDNPNKGYGFMLQLRSESGYRALVFCSSDCGYPELVPKLEVSYE